jgi:hypothetical protein
MLYFMRGNVSYVVFYAMQCFLCRCGKLLKSELDAQAHAARTQHASFSESTEEIKPLTEEEKEEQRLKLVFSVQFNSIQFNISLLPFLLQVKGWNSPWAETLY